MYDKPLQIVIPKKSFICYIRGYNIPHDRLKEELSFEVQGSEFSNARQMGWWDGYEYLYKYNPSIRTEGTFPFGLLSKVLNILREEGLFYEIEDNRNKSEKTVETQLNVKLRDYQERAVEKAIEKKHGILNIATGGGKCVSLHTLVPTDNGILPIGHFLEKQQNVLVKSKDSFVYTEEVYDGQLKDTIRITTSNGFELEGTYVHPVLVLNKDNHLVFKKLENLKKGDAIVLQYNTQLFSTKTMEDLIPFANKSDEFIKDVARFIVNFMEYGHIKDDTTIIFNTNSMIHHYILRLSKILFSNQVIEVDNQVIIENKKLVQLLKARTNAGIPFFVLQLNKEELYEFIELYINGYRNKKILKEIQVILMNFGVISRFNNNKLEIVNHNHFYRAKYNELKAEDAYLCIKDSKAEKRLMELISLFKNTVDNFDYEINDTFSYRHLLDVLERYKDYQNTSIYKCLVQIAKETYLFDTIEDIDYSCNLVADFVVPYKHSFVANGFVNHNTKTSTGIIHRLGRKTVFYVHTIDLLDQAKEEFEQTLGVPIGQVGGGVVDIKDITVATIQTVIQAFDKQYVNNDNEIDKSILKQDVTDITNHKEDIRNMVENAEVIFFDECQHLGAESFYEIAQRSYNATFRYGLSATPWRDDGKEIYIEAGLGEIIYQLSASWLIENDYLIRPYIKFYNGMQNNIYYDNRKYHTIYKEDIVENEKRNMLIAQIAVSIAKKNKTSLIIIQQKKHGEIIQKILKEKFNMDVPFVYGGTAKKKRRDLIAQFKRYYEPLDIKTKDGKIEKEKISPIMIASTIADEGLDIPHLSSVILAGGGKSTTRILQRIGRAIRLFNRPDLGEVKKTAFVVDFMDNSKYLRDHSLIRRATMQKESAFIIQ